MFFNLLLNKKHTHMISQGIHKLQYTQFIFYIKVNNFLEVITFKTISNS